MNQNGFICEDIGNVTAYFIILFKSIRHYEISSLPQKLFISDTTLYRSLFNFPILHSLFDCVKCVGKTNVF